MLWIFAERFFMAALRQCEKSEGCFAVFTAQPWTAAVLFKLQFSDGLLAADWNTLLNASGLSMEHIRAAATMCIQSKVTICCWATAVTKQPNGVDNVWMLLNLLLVGGHIGRPGAGACCVRGHSNVQG